MKYVQLLYNPNSGDTSFTRKLDQAVERFSQHGLNVMLFRSRHPKDMRFFFDTFTPASNCRAIVVSGGDGSINSVVSGMLKNNLTLPLGVIPSGTSNDFAEYLSMSNDLFSNIDIIARNKTQKIDAGTVNGEYFINVCSGGLLTAIAHSTNTGAKKIFGNLAYYLKAFGEIPGYTPMRLRITTNSQVIEDKFCLFFALNGFRAGGFSLANASADDGLIDLVAAKYMSLHELIGMFIKVKSGKHLSDPRVYYLKEPYIKLECLDGKEFISDIDGEQGPALPLEIGVCERTLDIIYNSEAGERKKLLVK